MIIPRCPSTFVPGGALEIRIWCLATTEKKTRVSTIEGFREGYHSVPIIPLKKPRPGNSDLSSITQLSRYRSGTGSLVYDS